MSKERVLFKSEERQSVKEVAAYLRQLADRVEAQQVTLRKGADELTLNFPGTVELEVEVEEELKKKNRRKLQLELEIEWYEGEEGPETEGHLQIN